MNTSEYHQKPPRELTFEKERKKGIVNRGIPIYTLGRCHVTIYNTKTKLEKSKDIKPESGIKRNLEDPKPDDKLLPKFEKP